MPDKPKDEKKETSTWVTVGGKKIEIPAGEEGEEHLRESLPSARGMKESNTKEAQKSYEQRFDINKTLFKIREQVVFDKYEKEGIISGFAGNDITIMSSGRVFKKHRDHVFKKSELIGDAHWDTMTKTDRALILTKVKLDILYSTKNWANLKPEIREVIKGTSPAGTTTATTGVHNPIYNPINEEKPVTERIEEEITRQHNQPSHEELENGKDDTGGKDEKKGKD